MSDGPRVLDTDVDCESSFAYFQVAALLADYVPDLRWSTAIEDGLEQAVKQDENDAKQGVTGNVNWPTLRKAYSHKKCPDLVHGRVVLIGSAGCCVDATTGLATALAFEDGSILAQRLGLACQEFFVRGKSFLTIPDLEEACKDYNVVRKNRYNQALRRGWGWGPGNSWFAIKLWNMFTAFLAYEWIYIYYVRPAVTKVAMFDPRDMWTPASYSADQKADAKVFFMFTLVVAMSPFFYALYAEW